jgi:hypothetical protein
MDTDFEFVLEKIIQFPIQDEPSTTSFPAVGAASK